MTDREPWGADTAEPLIPDPSGAEYEEWRERVREDERAEDEPDNGEEQDDGNA